MDNSDVKEKEFRNILGINIKENDTEINDLIIEGYINKYNTRSEYMGFFEEIEKGAFDKSLNENEFIPMLYNHDGDKILGSTRSGTLNLSSDDIGLKFELKINPKVSYAKDVYELVKSGDIRGCSFGFFVNKDEWKTLDNGINLRIIKDLTLNEVTITPYPAYKTSEASCRSFNNFKAIEQKKKEDMILKEKIEMELELIQLQ